MRQLVSLLLLLSAFVASAQEPKEAEEKASVKHLNRQEFFEKVWNYAQNPSYKLEGELPVLVDFYADWCVPCRIAAPIVRDIAQEYAGQIVVYKVNTDKEKQLSAELGIESLPTFLLLPKEGKPTTLQGTGATKEETKLMLKDAIRTHLLKNK